MTVLSTKPSNLCIFLGPVEFYCFPSRHTSAIRLFVLLFPLNDNANVGADIILLIALYDDQMQGK